MKERIIAFLQAENITSSQFAENIGVQASSISHILSGRNNPSLDFILKMLSTYPELDTEWLLFGKGNMYRIQDSFKETNENIDSEPVLKAEQPLLFGSVESEDKAAYKGLKGPDTGQTPVQPEAGNGFAKRVIILYENNTYQEFDT